MKAAIGNHQILRLPIVSQRPEAGIQAWRYLDTFIIYKLHVIQLEDLPSKIIFSAEIIRW